MADLLADCEAQLKANAKVKNFRRIPRGKPRRSGRRKWVAAAAGRVASRDRPGRDGVRRGDASVPGRPGTSDANKAGSDPQATAAPNAPPTARSTPTGKHHQEAWAKHLGMPVEFTNSIGMKFRLIPPGKFMMGSSKEEIDCWLKRKSR